MLEHVSGLVAKWFATLILKEEHHPIGQLGVRSFEIGVFTFFCKNKALPNHCIKTMLRKMYKQEFTWKEMKLNSDIEGLSEEILHDD